jgi:hypothetical protein
MVLTGVQIVKILHLFMENFNNNANKIIYHSMYLLQEIDHHGKIHKIILESIN